MKAIPVRVFWSLFLLMIRGDCSAAHETFNFNIGGISQGTLVMNSSGYTNEYFQKYSFKERSLTNLDEMIEQISSASFPVPAILSWFQMLDPNVDPELAITVLRWPTGYSNTQYRLSGPGYLLEHEVTNGYRTLPEALLAKSGSAYLGDHLVFFDPFLYRRIFRLQVVNQPVQPDFTQKTSEMKWQANFWWNQDCHSFIAGRPLEGSYLTMTVTALYKKNRLKRYRVEITGVPELAFFRLTLEREETKPVKNRVRPAGQGGSLGCKNDERRETGTGQYEPGSRSYNPTLVSYGSNSMSYTKTSGLNLKIEQIFLQLPGCAHFGHLAY